MANFVRGAREAGELHPVRAGQGTLEIIRIPCTARKDNAPCLFCSVSRKPWQHKAKPPDQRDDGQGQRQQAAFVHGCFSFFREPHIFILFYYFYSFPFFVHRHLHVR